MGLEMEGETRKRKITFIEEDEEDEDTKIEKFFALIRSTKDIRDQLLDSSEGSQARAKKVAVSEKKTETVRILPKKTSPKIPVIESGVSVAAVHADCSTDSVRINRSIVEEKSSKSAEKNNNFQGRNRLFLDLNLSL
ncbi:unnamed protein product [Amaranthus hypochondriacus]